MRRRIIKYTTLALAVVSIAIGGIFATRNDFGLGRNMEIMVNLMHALSTQFVDEVDADELMEAGAEGFTSMLDPYTVFIPEKDMPNFQAQTTGRYGGIGAMIRQKRDGVVIAEPYKGSPANEAGLIIGDKIVSINGHDVSKSTTSDVSKRLRGEPNTIVTVGVKRLLTGQVEEIKIRRQRIVLPSIDYVGWVSEGVGYIRHSDFTDKCYNDMRAAILKLQSEGELKQLILDYRDNGGGFMQSAIDILSLFVPKGTMVVEMRGRNAKTNSHKFFTQHEPLLPNTPIAVLINGNSASAAEIVAGAIQDLDRGVLLGQRSFGKGLVQSTMPLGYNAYAKITTAKYYTPSGRCIQAINYSQDGKAELVADSLIKEFKTVRGRKVYDGGGIMPDKIFAPEYMSRYAATLYVSGVIDDFGDEYFKKNHANTIDVDTFTISDEDYATFAEMVATHDINYKSDSRTALEKLQAALAKEKNNALSESIAAIEKGLNDDTKSLLATYREDLISTINDNIILRYAHSEGVIRHSLHSDKLVELAIETLLNSEEYKRIVTSQDTQRK